MSEPPTEYYPRQLKAPTNSAYSTNDSILRSRIVPRGERLSKDTRKASRERLIEECPFKVTNDRASPPAIIVSSIVFKQLNNRNLIHLETANDDPRIIAFLLGYVEYDGTICLNRVDYGVCMEGTLQPTADDSMDFIVPLYRGHNSDVFYYQAVRKCGMFGISCLLRNTDTVGESLELVALHVGYDFAVQPRPAPLSTIENLSEVLHQLRCKNKHESYGPILTDSNDKYAVRCGYTNDISDMDNIWAMKTLINGGCTQNNNDNVLVDAYRMSGLVNELYVVEITPSSDYYSASVRCLTLSPINTESRYSVSYGRISFDMVGMDSYIDCTIPMGNEYISDIHSKILDTQRQIGIAFDLNNSINNIVQDRKDKYNTVAVKSVPAPELVLRDTPKHRTPDPSIHVHTDSRYDELLDEQRRIRVLLEEQNQLLRTHITHTKDIIQNTQYHPSPHSVTRRYLRMTGTHTPRVAGVSSTLRIESSQHMNDSKSLSDIVDGIRSFEVEGYEETEYHHPISPFTDVALASPLDCTKNNEIAAPVTHRSNVVSFISQISNAVSESNDEDDGDVNNSLDILCSSSSLSLQYRNKNRNKNKNAQITGHSKRLLLPGTRKKGQNPTNRLLNRSSTSHITPTTQKYLDSLDSTNNNIQ